MDGENVISECGAYLQLAEVADEYFPYVKSVHESIRTLGLLHALTNEETGEVMSYQDWWINTERYNREHALKAFYCALQYLLEYTPICRIVLEKSRSELLEAMRRAKKEHAEIYCKLKEQL